MNRVGSGEQTNTSFEITDSEVKGENETIDAGGQGVKKGLIIS